MGVITTKYIDNTVLVSFDIKFIWQDQRQSMNDEACQSDVFLAEPDKLDIKRPTYVVFYLSCIISRFDGEKTAKQMKREAVLFELDDVMKAL